MNKLPDPVAWHYERDTDTAISFAPDRDDTKHWQGLYSESQVNELLAERDAALKMALEALEGWKNAGTFTSRIKACSPGDEAIAAIRKVLT